jgi:hypothetical protein
MLLIGEWKAYRSAVQKNEMLRFKAVTDDLYDGMGARIPRRPVLRLFGVAGNATDALRRYAVRHGIAPVERSRWPAPVLADPHRGWPPGLGPDPDDRRRLAWLARPMQHVYPALPDPDADATPPVAAGRRRCAARPPGLLVAAPLGARRRGAWQARCPHKTEAGRRVSRVIRVCPTCDSLLGPDEDAEGCVSCRGSRRDIVDHLVAVLETSQTPLPWWDVARMARSAGRRPSR